MGIFKTKKNKRYSYTPRFYKGEKSPFEIKHKFDDQRVTIQKTNLEDPVSLASFPCFLKSFSLASFFSLSTSTASTSAPL